MIWVRHPIRLCYVVLHFQSQVLVLPQGTNMYRSNSQIQEVRFLLPIMKNSQIWKKLFNARVVLIFNNKQNGPSEAEVKHRKIWKILVFFLDFQSCKLWNFYKGKYVFLCWNWYGLSLIGAYIRFNLYNPKGSRVSAVSQLQCVFFSFLICLITPLYIYFYIPRILSSNTHLSLDTS